MTTTALPDRAAPPALRYQQVRVLPALVYLVVGGLLGVLSIVSMALAFAVAVAATALVIPLPWGIKTLTGVWHWLADLRRAQGTALLGAGYLAAPLPHPNGGVVTQARARFRWPGTWIEFGYLCLMCVPAIVSGAFAVSWLVTGVTLATAPIWDQMLGANSNSGLLLLTSVGGVAMLAAVGPLVRGLATIDHGVAHAMLNRAGQQEVLEQQVHQLERQRAGAVDSSMSERRRLERDLHDGTQQRLTALALKLGMAKSQLKDLPPDAQLVLDEAHHEAKQTLVELRNLVRGLHPAVLDDRGLDAALSGVVARSAIPADLTVDLFRRPSRTIESVAYFVVSEALNNAVKHSQASQVSVSVTGGHAWMTVSVADNGIGGADTEGGTGLAGLRQRVEAVDGAFALDSPVGGPTVLTVGLPCES